MGKSDGQADRSGDDFGAALAERDPQDGRRDGLMWCRDAGRGVIGKRCGIEKTKAESFVRQEVLRTGEAGRRSQKRRTLNE